MTALRDVGKVHPELTVAHLAQRAAVVAGNADRFGPFLAITAVALTVYLGNVVVVLVQPFRAA